LYASEAYPLTTSAFSLLKINIKTGRKNQIRVQLSDIGHPIVGDKKYGCKHNIMRRMALHAYFIEYTNKGKTYTFKTDYPKEFKRMFNI
jgi:23S rRNA pseudouridine1911/1915/1917 synthase